MPIPSARATRRPISAWWPQVLIAALVLLGLAGSRITGSGLAAQPGCGPAAPQAAADPTFDAGIAFAAWVGARPAKPEARLPAACICVQDGDVFGAVAETESEGSERDDEEHDPSDAELVGGSHPRAPPRGPRVDHWNRRVHHAESRRLCGARAPPTRA